VSELRVIGKNEDGTHLFLTDSQDVDYSLRISDTLRSLVNQPRLAAVRTEEAEGVSVREIQARLRSGEPMENIARDANCSLDKIERFSGPILQERTYIIGLAQEVVMRKESGREPVNFEEVVTSRLAPRQVDMSAVEWLTWRLDDGTWIIRIHYPNREGLGTADWNFDLHRRCLSALDEGAKWMVGEEVAPARSVDHGLVYGTHPTASRAQEPPIGRDGPRLVSLRVEPEPEAVKDGVTARAKVPSWDEIMFGTSKKSEDESDF